MQTQGPAPSETPDDDALTGGAERWARPMMQQDLAALGRLRDLGMEIAEAMGRQVAQAAEPTPACEDAASVAAEPPAPVFTGDIVLSFARVSRAVRMTCALRARLIEEIEQLDDVQGRRSDGRRDRRRDARKDQVARLLTRIIEDETVAPGDNEGEAGEGRESESEASERLIDEACERLEDDDRYGDVLHRPVSEVIALICRDLGLSPDWPTLAQEAWAQAELRSGPVGAPLASFSSPARGGGGPRSGGGGASLQSAPSVTARMRRATFPARGEGKQPAPDDYWPGVDPPRDSP